MKKIVEFRQFLPKRKKGSHKVSEIVEFRKFLPFRLDFYARQKKTHIIGKA